MLIFEANLQNKYFCMKKSCFTFISFFSEMLVANIIYFKTSDRRQELK